ncbi:MAG: hypothetical protein WCD12_02640 [Candidatus Binatus sp.]|uniref:hypothetical protein n=1 Tax=Candidatus Binatus sp. TaxID=2811406 RepID=UPI003C78C26E
MLAPDSLKTNAYRILRLSANATASEVHKAAARMRREAALGVTDTTAADIPHLGEIPRTERDIRSALGRLANPEQRLRDRLFWFHVPPESKDAKAHARPTDEANQMQRIACDHDEALGGLLASFEAGVDEPGLLLWIQALRRWHQVVSDDNYWVLTLALEERGAFEPTALPSEVDALRDDAVRLAAEVLVIAGRDALARNDAAIVRRILDTLGDLADTGFWAALAQEDIAAPAIEDLRALCDAVREEVRTKIIREQGTAERNKGPCDAALKRFREEIEPALKRVIQLVPPDHEAVQRSREEAALCLSGIATDYTWADDFIASEKLHEEALSVAHNTLGAIRIEDGLAQIREAARKQRVFGGLKPISSAPSLRTINGVGFALYGNSDHDADTESYVTTYYFAVLFIPIIPLARYRVIQVGKQYRFLGKMPLRKGDLWHLGISLTAIIAVILIGVISSMQDSDSSYVPATVSSDNSSPDSRNTELSDLKARIDSGRSRMAELNTELGPTIEKLTTLNTRMETLDKDLKSLDEQHKAGVRIDSDDYNTKVKAYNALVRKKNALVAANRNGLQNYGDLLKQDSELVDQYNALLK